MTRLFLTASRWRLLNALDAAGVPVNAAALVNAQGIPTDDLRWFAESGLVVAGVPGRAGVRIDLGDHLAHGGAPAAVTLALTGRGRTVLRAPLNRVLRLLADGERSLQTVLADAAVKVTLVAEMRLRRLLAAKVRATGEPLGSHELALLPAATITMRLSEGGRDYLPLTPDGRDQIETAAAEQRAALKRLLQPAAGPRDRAVIAQADLRGVGNNPDRS
jgi:hypothetical protein